MVILYYILIILFIIKMMKFNIFNWKTIEDFNTEFKNAYLEMYIDQDNNKNINWGYIGEDCTLFIDKSIFSYINGGKILKYLIIY